MEGFCTGLPQTTEIDGLIMGAVGVLESSDFYFFSNLTEHPAPSPNSLSDTKRNLHYTQDYWSAAHQPPLIAARFPRASFGRGRTPGEQWPSMEMG